MASKRAVLIALAVVGLIALIAVIAWRSQRSLEAALPPREIASNESVSLLSAAVYAQETGGTIYGVLGTGSMAPWIRGGKPTERVAYAVTRPGATFSDVQRGDVCIYSSGDAVVIHSAAKQTRNGWVMSGLANSRSDIWMTPLHFRGIVVRVFTW